jgi:hypothetical protein
MSEWWTYSLSDFLLFSPRTYYRLFELYNLAVWPWHIVAIMLGLAVLALWLRGGTWQGRAVAVILAACWLFVAWAYLLARYDTINWAASYFAAGFALEALLLVWTGLIRDRLPLRSAAGSSAGRLDDDRAASASFAGLRRRSAPSRSNPFAGKSDSIPILDLSHPDLIPCGAVNFSPRFAAQRSTARALIVRT